MLLKLFLIGYNYALIKIVKFFRFNNSQSGCIMQIDDVFHVALLYNSLQNLYNLHNTKISENIKLLHRHYGRPLYKYHSTTSDSISLTELVMSKKAFFLTPLKINLMKSLRAGAHPSTACPVLREMIIGDSIPQIGTGLAIKNSPAGAGRTKKLNI
jgi:hypothetical protein